MASCRLTLELERDVVSPGEPLSGVVVVDVEKECRLEKLTLTPRWRTRGKGNVDTGAERTRVLLKDVSWAPGRYRVPFSVACPGGPSSHEGQVVSVGWLLSARAHLDWQADPEAEVPFTLRDGDPEALDVDSLSSLKAREDPRNSVWSLFGGLLSAGGGGVCMWVGAREMLEGRPEDLLQGMVPGLVLGAIGLYFIGVYALARLARWKLGGPEVHLEPLSMVKPGGRVRVRVVLRPRSRVTLRNVVATLLGQEEAWHGRGSSKNTHKHTFREVRQALAPAGLVLDAGEERTLEADVVLPEQAATSFHAPHNEVRWTLRVHAALSRGSSWSFQRVLTVGRSGRSARPGSGDAPRLASGGGSQPLERSAAGSRARST